MSIAYDPGRAALYSPGRGASLLRAGVAYSDLQLAVEAARLAYIRAEQSQADYRRLTEALARVDFEPPSVLVDAATGTEAFATFRRSDALALIAFRGTEPGDLTDIVADLNVLPCAWETAGKVHSGFAKAARAIAPQVRRWLDADSVRRSQLILTGHSLGAAVATLLASVFPECQLITLGSPRVGDRAFADLLSAVKIARIVNCCDVVAEAPPELPSYTHVRAPLYIARDGAIVECPDAAFVKTDRLQARFRYAMRYAWRPGAVWVRELADHAPINYVRAFFP